MDAITFKRIEEYRINKTLRKEIAWLLNLSFPGYPTGRTYFKQLPAFRFLAFAGDRLAGHIALEYRMINAGGTPASIFGVSDLCVDPDLQKRRIGEQLLQETEKEALCHGLDFVVAISADPAYYEKMGYQAQNNLCRWVSIGDHQLIGLVQGRLPGGLMVKSLSGKKWGDGLIDFLGYMF